MDLFDAIQGRKSIRRFKQTPVPDEDIKKILDAGRLAPSANNTQPWSFVVIKDRKMLRKMADAARAMVDRMVPHAKDEKQAQRLAAYKSNYYVFFENAPMVIAVFMEAYDAGTDRILAKMGYSAEEIRRLRPLPGLQSVSAAVQNMLLAIHALGYASCWVEGTLLRKEEEMKKVLGIPDHLRRMIFLPIGAPAGPVEQASKKSLDELVHWEAF